MILLFGAIILFSAFLRAIESGTLFTISDSGMKGALNKVLEQYFRIFARHKELEKYFRDLLHLRLWWVVCPPFPISNWKYGRYLLHRLSENQTLEILVENSQTRMMKAFFQISNLSTLVLLPSSIYLLILVWTQEKRWFISGAIMINLDKKYGLYDHIWLLLVLLLSYPIKTKHFTF